MARKQQLHTMRSRLFVIVGKDSLASKRVGLLDEEVNKYKDNMY